MVNLLAHYWRLRDNPRISHDWFPEPLHVEIPNTLGPGSIVHLINPRERKHEYETGGAD